MNEMVADKQIIFHTEGMKNNLVEISMAPPLKFQLKNSPPFGWRIFYVGIPFYFLSYTGNILILMILPVYERKWYPDRANTLRNRRTLFYQQKIEFFT